LILIYYNCIFYFIFIFIFIIYFARPPPF